MQKELRQPVVACPLGKLYNKDALLEFLLVPASETVPVAATPFGADGIAIAGHITSLKDVVELNLTLNPDYAQRNSKTSQAGAEEGFSVSKWICPLSQREMNGAVRFVALLHKCRNVVAEASLKAMKSNQKGKATVCGVCGEDYVGEEEDKTLLLNPTDKDEIERMKAAWEEKQRLAKEARKSKKANKKRKTADDGEDLPLKKAKSALINPASAHAHTKGTPSLPLAVAEALEAKRAANPSNAVSALYQKDPSKKSTCEQSCLFH